jgi:hypothetical protein
VRLTLHAGKITPARPGVKTHQDGYRSAMRSLLGLVVLAWLVIGIVAAGQRGYYGDGRDVSCKTLGDTALTIVAGPLNYVGVNPKVECEIPEPSR